MNKILKIEEKINSVFYVLIGIVLTSLVIAIFASIFNAWGLSLGFLANFAIYFGLKAKKPELFNRFKALLKALVISNAIFTILTILLAIFAFSLLSNMLA